jgi:hypothetical protein
MEEWRVPAIALTAAVLGALITLLGTHLASSREYDAKMVEIAMGVLRASPSKDNKDLIGVRTWALKVIERHSGQRFESDEQRNAVRNNVVPYVSSSYR